MRRTIKLDYADAIGGVLLIVGGIWFALYAMNYDMGTARRMGPAYFPFGIGCLVALFGLGCLLGALRRAGAMPVIEWRPFFAICGAVLAFTLVIERFGLIPATIALVLISALADEKPSATVTIILAAALCLVGVGIFSWGLGIPMPILRWTN
ncbi:tripartite tricarboxylate transporter TctB family protein [Pararoseomonas baculiformis]|uniref:tripartite tricarboxylate transporter TctB family protein n=1 Tax=Pararoseomonas baculiformis TaxID=2820812 RepID=UPI001FD7D1E4|nr:tripartite tricarboxylate transporter TctB family protein [Pararoseomonas baculiformis]